MHFHLVLLKIHGGLKDDKFGLAADPGGAAVVVGFEVLLQLRVVDKVLIASTAVAYADEALLVGVAHVSKELFVVVVSAGIKVSDIDVVYAK